MHTVFHVFYLTKCVIQVGVALSPGRGFGPGGKGYVRFALVADEARLVQAAGRIAEWLKKHRVQ